MKDLRKELIDFAKWYSARNGEYFRITSYDVDKYIKSINSDAQAESPTVGDNEAKEKKCKCEHSSWDRDAGCFVCDECGEHI